MTVANAKKLVLDGITRDLGPRRLALVDPASPDPSDPGKLIVAGKTARVVHHYSGWHVPINLSWFNGTFEEPRINDQSFYWYAFAIPHLNRNRIDHYLICDFLQVRDWVLEFGAPKGRDHRDHNDWMANIHVYDRHSREEQAYFRWGDEPLVGSTFLDRIVKLDNIDVVAQKSLVQHVKGHVGAYGIGGESEAHRRLKIYASYHPELLQLSPQATPELEHEFVTGDRVDLIFNNHGPLRTVVEAELDTAEGILVGVHQAIKYRSLAAAESSLGLVSPDVAAAVVSYADGGDVVHRLARAYDVRLITVDKQKILIPD